MVNFFVGTAAMEHPDYKMWSNYDWMTVFIKTLFLFVDVKYDILAKTQLLSSFST